MREEKKEKLANWIFTIVLFWLILPWSGIITRLVSSVKEQMSKPFISQEFFDQKWSEVREIFDQAKSKVKTKEYTALDYARGITKIGITRSDLESKYRFDPRQATIISHWNESYGTYRELIKERDFSGRQSMLALNQALSQAEQERGMHVDWGGILTQARLNKFFRWLFLFAWPLSLLPLLLLYIWRCQIRKISFKEMVVLSPLKFLGCWIFGIFGLMVNFPNDTAGLRRYLRLKNAYMCTRDKGLGYWLSSDEEARLWQEARIPLERFDQRVQQTLIYSKAAAFASSLFICIFIAPFRALAGQAPKEQTTVTAKVTAEEEQKKKSVLGLFDIANFKLGGLVQVKAMASKGQDLSWGKRLQLIGIGKIFTLGKFQINYAGKADFSKTDFTLPYASIEVVPGLDFIDKFCLGRIIDPTYQSSSPGAIQTIEFPYSIGFPADKGISVAGHIGQVSWVLGEVDGNGGLLLWKDPNKAKDLVANLTWAPKSFLGLDAFKWRTVYRGGDQVSDGKRFILGSDISLTEGKFAAEVGWIAHREGTKNLDGGWVLGFATFGKWRPLAQYDFQVGKGGRLTAGLNFLVDNTRRIQFNVEKTALGTLWRAQYQAGF